MKNLDYSSRQSGNAWMIALGAVVLVALGGLGYYGYTMQKPAEESAAAEPAAGTSADAAKADTPEGKNSVEPGNPVVAKIGDLQVTRLDVFNFIRELPENVRSMPVNQLYPLALDQVISNKLIDSKAAQANLDANEDVQKQLAEAKTQIVRNVFVQQELSKLITDSELKTAYDKYVSGLPKVEEVKARHILVKDEAKAKELIAKIKGGESFEALAKENSTDGTAAQGGELGYFAKDSVVPEFGTAAFAMVPGAMSDTPVKTQFGYHIIKVEDKRMRPAPTFEEAKNFLEGNLRREKLEGLLEDWKKDAKIEKFDINGQPLASADAPMIPAAKTSDGKDEKKAAEAAPASAPAAAEPAKDAPAAQ